MTPLRLYNSLTKTKEEFTPRGKTVGLYTCGPTVYHYAHIGNLRTFLFEDVLRRTLQYLGYKVDHVMNITDVGHLTSDADTGEDKMQKGAAREKKSVWDIAKLYTDAFILDFHRLNILAPTHLPRATAHIAEQIALIALLEKKGHTYRTEDGIYFDTSKFPAYGKLSGQKLSEKEAGKRVAALGKRNASDFALWKFSYPGGTEKPADWSSPVREMEWESPWGVGFPGWHIECSAMSRKYLGQPFDIHTGGIDHLPVHHENEIAQSEAAFGVPLANMWMHGEFLLLGEGEKMSKSADNFLTLQTLIDRGFDPLAFRYFTFGAHYRAPITFSRASMEAAQNALKNLRGTVRTWEKPKGACPDFEERFAAAIADDLDMPNALSVVWEMVKSDNPSSAKAASLKKFDDVLGLGLEQYIGRPLKVPKNVKALLDERDAARKAKKWPESDRLRDEIHTLGYGIEDTIDGQTVTDL